MPKLKKFAQHFVHLLYPRKCMVCDKIISPDKFLCEDCVKFEIYTNKKCRGCSGKKCSCNLKDYVYDDCIAALVYDGEISEAYKKFKFRGQFSFSKYFSDKITEIFLEKLNPEDFDILCFVPGSHAKRKNGGYNPAKMLAYEFARNINVPVSNVLKKVKKTKVQHKLKMKDRRLNVRGAYSTRFKIEGKNVLLFDDIRTSGGTLDECSRELKFAGANKVTAVSVFAPKPFSKELENEIS